MQLDYVDVTGDGTALPAPMPQGLDQTVYNGSGSCGGCGIMISPVQALHSDLCSNCTKRKAAKALSNRMA